jgi:alpha-N-arabinofuranosidase
MTRYKSTHRVVTLLACLAVSCSISSPSASEGNLVQNPDFEQPGSGPPAQWVFEERVRHKGSVGIERTSAGATLALQPNARNVAAEQDATPLSIGQVFAIGEYRGLRGATLHVSADMGASGPATARLRLIVIRRGGELLAVELKQAASDGKLVGHFDSLTIPDDNRTQLVILGLDALGTAGKASFDNVYLGTTPKPRGAARAAAGEAQVSIRVDAARAIRRIPDTLYGVNIEWIWDGNGLWDARANDLDKDVVQLTRELRPTLLRFPGGIFADFYGWRDGTGPRDKRPTTRHIPDGPESRHNLGTDEALEFARRTGSNLLITVNIATGTPEDAVEWLRYLNRPEQTKGQPPTVRYWEIGNENYFAGDAPYLRKAALDGAQYAERFAKFAQALKQADPRIQVLAIAQENYERDFEPVHRDWMPALLSKAGHLIDFIAVHNGYVPGLERDQGWDLRTVYSAMLAGPIQLRHSLDRVSEQVRKHAPKHASRIKLAVTEWAPSFQLALDGRFLDHPKTLGSALFTASALKTYIEHPDLEIANYFKLTDRLWQGLIGARGEKFAPTAPYFALRMYRNHFGSTLVETLARSPTYDSAAVGYVPALRDVPYLDVVSSLSADGKKLYIMVVNKSFDQALAARIDIQGFKARRAGRAFVLTGTGIDANTGTQLFSASGVKWARQAADPANPRFDKGGPGEITVKEEPITAAGTSFTYSFGKHSVTAIELTLEGS